RQTAVTPRAPRCSRSTSEATDYAPIGRSVSTDFVDLQFRGSPRVVATAILQGADGHTLMDPGPPSCLPALESGLRDRGLTLRDVRTLLLTHIHLDHAGASGTIVERVPGVTVYVHERGAPPLVRTVR